MKTYPVLLVENHPNAQRTAELALVQQNCKVWAASTAEAAKSWADNRYFALIVMATTLPDASGIELSRAIQQDDQCPNQYTPIVAMTTEYDDEVGNHRCIASGMRAVFAKPLTTSKVKEALSFLHSFDQLPIYDKEAAWQLHEDTLVILSTLRLFIHDLSFESFRLQRLYTMKKWEALRRAIRKYYGIGTTCATLRLNACLGEIGDLLHLSPIDEVTIAHQYVRLQQAIHEVTNDLPDYLTDQYIVESVKKEKFL